MAFETRLNSFNFLEEVEGQSPLGRFGRSANESIVGEASCGEPTRCFNWEIAAT